MSSYYVHLDPHNAQPLHSTWTKPKQFSRIVREDEVEEENDDDEDDPYSRYYQQGKEQTGYDSQEVEEEEEDPDDKYLDESYDFNET